MKGIKLLLDAGEFVIGGATGFALGISALALRAGEYAGDIVDAYLDEVAEVFKSKCPNCKKERCAKIRGGAQNQIIGCTKCVEKIED